MKRTGSRKSAVAGINKAKQNNALLSGKRKFAPPSINYFNNNTLTKLFYKNKTKERQKKRRRTKTEYMYIK